MAANVWLQRAQNTKLSVGGGEGCDMKNQRIYSLEVGGGGGGGGVRAGKESAEKQPRLEMRRNPKGMREDIESESGEKSTKKCEMSCR